MGDYNQQQANIIVNLLKSEKIAARVDTSYLSGKIRWYPVYVEPSKFTKAEIVIKPIQRISNPSKARGSVKILPEDAPAIRKIPRSTIKALQKARIPGIDIPWAEKQKLYKECGIIV